MQTTIVGMFDDAADARRALYELESGGYDLNEVTMVTRERHEPVFPDPGWLPGGDVSPNQATTTPMDLGLAAPQQWVDPNSEEAGFGVLIAAGRLARSLGGASTGVVAGGLAGALGDVGIPNDLALDLVDRVRLGKEAMLTIRVENDRAEEAEKLFVENSAGVVYRGASRATAYNEGERAAAAAQRGR